MKNKTILIIAGVVTGTLGLMSMTGTFLPTPASPTAYGYSPETYQLQESYDRAAETLTSASLTRAAAEEAYNNALKTESSAKQSNCALVIALGNSKLKDVGDSDPSETVRLKQSVQEASVCLITNTPAF